MLVPQIIEMYVLYNEKENLAVDINYEFTNMSSRVKVFFYESQAELMMGFMKLSKDFKIYPIDVTYTIKER